MSRSGPQSLPGTSSLAEDLDSKSCRLCTRRWHLYAKGFLQRGASLLSLVWVCPVDTGCNLQEQDLVPFRGSGKLALVHL